jgi:hypothetical protein
LKQEWQLERYFTAYSCLINDFIDFLKLSFLFFVCFSFVVQEPDNIDKEFLRKWYAGKCDPYTAVTLPDAPAELVNELSRRYIMIYEILTGLSFKEQFVNKSVEDLSQAITNFFHQK